MKHSHMSIASMLGTLRHAEIRLGARALADETGSKLVHDVRNLLVVLEAAEQTPPTTLAELLELTNASASVHERVNDYVLKRNTARPHGHRGASVLSPEEIAKATEAFEGPKPADTMAACPACAGCLLCGDRRFVSMRDASDWIKRNVPKT